MEDGEVLKQQVDSCSSNKAEKDTQTNHTPLKWNYDIAALHGFAVVVSSCSHWYQSKQLTCQKMRSLRAQ